MDNLLKYYYEINNSEIIAFEKDYLVFDNDNYTYLLKEIKNININYFINIINKLKTPNYYGKFLLNIEQKYISKYDNKEYILIKLNGIINEEVLLKDMINNNLKFRINNEKNTDLVDLWSKKIDYLEYQISELAKENQMVLNSFSFFVGLAENAISFISVNNINLNNLHKSICHTRIKSRELNTDYYNPLNILIDYEIRDYAEYIKSKILLKEDILKDVNYIIYNASLNIDDIKLFYARLMFPTLYFDKVEEILIDKKEEKELEIFIDNIIYYLNALNDISIEIQKKGISLDIPKWIKEEY